MKLVVANWKSNPQSVAEAQTLFNLVKEGLKGVKSVEVVICPPYTQFSIFNSQFSNNIKLGAQDVFWKQGGAFTGEISPLMLKNLGCEYVIIGHSERRALGESDELINKKIKAVLEVNLKPILCVGEEEKNTASRFKKIKSQLTKALSIIEKLKLENLIIAYEPVWAIGTGEPCDFKEAKGANSFIKQILKEFFGEEIGNDIPVLYGGSVNSESATGYIEESEMDGLLVGGASLEAEEFVKIVRKIAKG